MGLKIALISRDNGVGLSLDVNLLTGLFESAGHEVCFHDWQSGSMPRADVAFHLELISKNLAKYAQKNVLVPNLEWFPVEWIKYLPAFDQIWAKSSYALRFCSSKGGKNVHFTGFLGTDIYRPDVNRELRCMHLRGRSTLKGTEQVVEAWRRSPGLPPLTIISKENLRLPESLSRRVNVVISPTDEDRNRLMNQASIHVCPSVAEGWGHYIVEGMSVGATIVTTDASPMNEHIRPEWGYLVGVTKTREHHHAVLTYTEAGLISEAVRRATALTPENRQRVADLTRRRFLARNMKFKETALRLVQS